MNNTLDHSLTNQESLTKFGDKAMSLSNMSTKNTEINYVLTQCNLPLGKVVD
ncbi:MAG: hypothetical protein O9264_12985 [Leptospira sp.]|nr:hypothetical protein [Leptospira sp.]